MKKILMASILLLTSILILFPSNVYASDSENNSIEYVISEEDMKTDEQNQIIEYLKSEGLPVEECLVVDDGIMLLDNDLSNYKTTYSAYKYPVASGWASNQPTNGVKISQGGSIYYSTSGGGTASVSVAFGSPYGTVSFSLPLGKRSTSVSGYSVNIPSDGYYKLWVANTYRVQKYIVYYKTGKDDGSYYWKEYGSGTTKTLYKVNLTAKKISS